MLNDGPQTKQCAFALAVFPFFAIVAADGDLISLRNRAG